MHVGKPSAINGDMRRLAGRRGHISNMRLRAVAAVWRWLRTISASRVGQVIHAGG
jgi:hypothetical protein